MGESNLPYSYLKYLADRIIGIEFSAELVDKVTLYGYIITLGLSLWLNFRDRRRGEGEKGRRGEWERGRKGEGVKGD